MAQTSRAAKRSQPAKRQIRDAEVTQKQILDAAEIEFSRHGLKGARISDIAKQAEITTAMIHYYFDNKEGLYKAVLQRPIDEVQHLIDHLELDHLSPEDAIVFVIRMAITNEFHNPYRQMLWFQEASQNQGLYFKQGNWSGLFARITKVLERGMESGYFRALDPMLTLTHILGVCIFYFSVQDNWKHLMPEIDRLSAENVEKHTESAIAFILAAIRK
ncbi:MAG TPA: TetR/AcrR family transcriptional regulator [Leptolyngbya sp.]|nr:TetR/AcrR family transcriptional regulator [Leptolyngbya sp.]